MSFKTLFDLLNCERLIIFEDDFTPAPFTKKNVLLDLWKMDKSDWALCLNEIQAKYEELARSLEVFLEQADYFFEDIEWDNVPKNNILPAFDQIEMLQSGKKEILQNAYEAIDDDLLEEVQDIFLPYGIGISIPPLYEELMNDSFGTDGRTCSRRVYTEFDASVKMRMQGDLHCSEESKSVICIIDNILQGYAKAEEIVNQIKEISADERKNIVGAILSSNEDWEMVDEEVFFERVSKQNPSLLSDSIARSAYNYYIYRLKVESLREMNKTFDSAVANRNIARYMSSLAAAEGTTEYEAIQDWLSLVYSINLENNDSVDQLIRLSKVVSEIDDELTIDESLELLNTFEAFDYNINERLLPVCAGDIFTSNNEKYYILIGQDCDITMGESRSRKNAAAELLEIRLGEPDEFEKKFRHTYENVVIESFRATLDDSPKSIIISYDGRKYIANEIINLCMFNKSGVCEISLEEEIVDKGLVANYQIEYHAKMQEFYSDIKSLIEVNADSFNNFVSQGQQHALMAVHDYSEDDDNRLIFPLRRVCRLKHKYVFYLYKLFLEHRGRQPFNLMNLSRQNHIMVNFTFEGYCASAMVVVVQALSQGKEKRDVPWVIEQNDFFGVLSKCGLEILIAEEEFRQGKLYFPGRTKELSLEDGRKLQIRKTKKGAIIELI